MADRDIIREVLKLEAANCYVYEQLLALLPAKSDRLRYILMDLRDGEREHVRLILAQFSDLRGDLSDFTIGADSRVESGLTVADVLRKYLQMFTEVKDGSFPAVIAQMEEHATRFFQENMGKLKTPRARKLLQQLIDSEADHLDWLREPPERGPGAS
ncbi:MAG: hypothetical protein HY719_10715 [Planctomycetes bacterium]|nr:hypothetical protein [Planctomycetota bacterium]